MYQPQLNKGFTLLELQISLGIIAILLFLSVPVSLSLLEQQREKEFLETFEHDVLYIQHLASSTLNNVRITFQSDKYTIFYESKAIEVREYPPGVRMAPSSFRYLSFTKTGSIRQAGQILITTPSHHYSAVFPPGKGRFHLVEY
ncbi:competence type IV pilus minor pilin ComGD [Virgibacillus xinjiangensis]|uniref:Competence type IV pilus minor pilin ComGD n=1 Tax=Virgibacillus xinjiangensis TaxID=393090 RepID=A0ABV7CS67_9BACI